MKKKFLPVLFMLAFCVLTMFGCDMHQHIGTDIVWTWSDDYEYVTASFTCIDCEEEVEVVIEKDSLEIEQVLPTCIEDGYVTYTATLYFNKGEDFEEKYTESITLTLNRLGHNYGDGYEADEENHWIKCHNANCNQAEQVEPHSLEQEVITPATYTTKETSKFTCSKCGHTFTKVTADENKSIINSVEDFVAFAKDVNNNNYTKGATYTLTSDLDLKNVTWEPINQFKGTFDGNNKTIKNLTVTGEKYVGLFGNVWQQGTVIKNFTVENAKITGSGHTAVIIANTAHSTLTGLTVKNAEIYTNHYAGAIAGYTYDDITDCHVDGLLIDCKPNLVTENGVTELDNGDKVGGIAGITFGSTKNCSVNNVEIYAYRDAGAICGYFGKDGVTMPVISNNSVSNSNVLIDKTLATNKPTAMTIGIYVGRHDNGVVEDNNTYNKNVLLTIIADEVTAQTAIDSIVVNTTIILKAGNYEELRIGQSKQRSTDVRPDGTGTERYKRTLTNITIMAEDKGDVIVNGANLKVGHFYDSGINPVTGKEIISTTQNNYYGYLDVTNLSIVGLKLTQGIYLGVDQADMFNLDGFSILNCHLTGKQETMATNAFQNKLLHIGAGAVGEKMKNIKVENCSVQYTFQGIYAQGNRDLLVKNCTFKNIHHNAIAIQDGGKGTIYNKGIITIENNTFENGNDRVFRFGNFSEGAVTIKNNAIINYKDGDSEIFKAGSIGENVLFVLDNNIYNGIQLATTLTNKILLAPANA